MQVLACYDWQIDSNNTTHPFVHFLVLQDLQAILHNVKVDGLKSLAASAEYQPHVYLEVVHYDPVTIVCIIKILRMKQCNQSYLLNDSSVQCIPREYRMYMYEKTLGMVKNYLRCFTCICANFISNSRVDMLRNAHAGAITCCSCMHTTQKGKDIYQYLALNSNIFKAISRKCTNI